jgi:hypothetical protein
LSADFIVPLRQELFALRERIAWLRGGRIERPQPWTAQPQQAQGQPYYAQRQGY